MQYPTEYRISSFWSNCCLQVLLDGKWYSTNMWVGLIITWSLMNVHVANQEQSKKICRKWSECDGGESCYGFSICITCWQRSRIDCKGICLCVHTHNTCTPAHTHTHTTHTAHTHTQHTHSTHTQHTHTHTHVHNTQLTHNVLLYR